MKRTCLKCFVKYWDDGYVWCPTCDVKSFASLAIQAVVRQQRQEKQDELAKAALSSTTESHQS